MAPEVHPYGIADVVQLWPRSRWWLHDGAAVALIDLPGSHVPVLYAISAGVDESTLNLVERILPLLPPRFETTAAVGFTERIARSYTPLWCDGYVKMHLARPEALGPLDPSVARLGRRDLVALQGLFATDPHAGDFFHPGLLDTGYYLGCWEADVLVACAGVHVVEPEHGVAAIGNVATRPGYRRRGLGRRVLTTLCRRLIEDMAVVGLNVRRDNLPAIGLYTNLGFDPLVEFEEGEFVATEDADTDVRYAAASPTE